MDKVEIAKVLTQKQINDAHAHPDGSIRNPLIHRLTQRDADHDYYMKAVEQARQDAFKEVGEWLSENNRVFTGSIISGTIINKLKSGQHPEEKKE
jgi:hypothetical protein